MSQIDELISKYCPEGVPSFLLGSLLVANRGGGTPSTAKPEYWDGDIPWTSIGDMNTPGMYLDSTRRRITDSGLKNSSTSLVKAGDVLVAVKISPGAMKIASRDIAINQDIRGLTLDSRVNPAFLVYFFRTFSIIGDGTIVKGITNATLEKVRVPIPPLDVQNEIVRILNTFTALEAELEAELEVRKAQYKFYRNLLVTFGDDSDAGVQRISIGDLLQKLNSYTAIEKSEYKQEGQFPIINQAQELIAGYSDREDLALPNNQYIVFGDHTRVVKFFDGPFVPGESGTLVFSVEKICRPKYLYFAFKNLEIQSRGYNRHWSVVKNIEISVPPLETQDHIVEILDRFSELIGEFSGGLPAEIAKRRQQYEYYRSKLLSFKKMEVA